MKALILAAGYATRLYPYTKNFPKPLLEVGGRPIIQYLTEKLDGLDGLSEILVVTNARFAAHFTRWAKKSHTRTKIRVLNDGTRTVAQRLGAIGDMRFAFTRAGYGDDYLVVGGDNFFDEPLTGFVRRAQKNAPRITIGVCDIKKKSEARRYGVVELDRRGAVAHFQEKPARPRTSTVAMCLYYFPASNVRLIEAYLASENPSDASGAYIRWLARRGLVHGYMFRNYWADIGHINAYHMVQQLKKGERQR